MVWLQGADPALHCHRGSGEDGAAPIKAELARLYNSANVGAERERPPKGVPVNQLILGPLPWTWTPLDELEVRSRYVTQSCQKPEAPFGWSGWGGAV